MTNGFKNMGLRRVDVRPSMRRVFAGERLRRRHLRQRSLANRQHSVPQSRLVEAAHGSEIIEAPGGSASNVAKGLALLSGASASGVRFVGMVGPDETGRRYAARLQSAGVEAHLVRPVTLLLSGALSGS